MMFKYAKLKGKIKEVFGSQRAFAEAMEMKPSLLSSKLSNRCGFSQEEMKKAADLLNLKNAELVYFLL